MSMTYETLPDGIIVIRFSAFPSLSDIKSSIDEISPINDSGYRLWDISKGFKLSTQEITELVTYAKSRWPKSVKVAFIATDPLAFGMTRMFSSLKAGRNEDYNVFDNEAEALSFLRE